MNNAPGPVGTISHLLEDAHKVRVRLGMTIVHEHGQTELLRQHQKAGKVLQLCLHVREVEPVVVETDLSK